MRTSPSSTAFTAGIRGSRGEDPQRAERSLSSAARGPRRLPAAEMVAGSGDGLEVES